MFRAELLAIRSVLATKVAVLVAVIGLLATQVTLVTLLPALARGEIGPGAAALGDDFPGFGLTTGADQLGALSPLGATTGGGSLGVVVLAMTLLGVLAGTSDFRFGGIVGAALASPRRERILVAKAAATGTVSAVVAIVLVIVTAGTLTVSLAVSGVPFVADALVAAGVLARGAVVVVLLALIGLAVGVIARNQLAGVLVMLAILIGEPIIQATAALMSGAAPVWTQFLPVALAQAAVGSAPAVLPPLVATAGLAVVTAVALTGAALGLRNRDV
jgi:hypothetical protein